MSQVFQERQTRPEKGLTQDGKLIEWHLYPGNRCNRACSFCTVLGSPTGWYHPYTPELLDQALAVVAQTPEAALKFYGGEPTLDHENVIWAIGYLRAQHFQGAIVIYSNGIHAQELLAILQADPLGRTTASLNYSITTGDGAPPMPAASLRLLETIELANPRRIAIGHPDIVDAGKGVEGFEGNPERARDTSRCPHCYPVLTTQGIFHACPFAIEQSDPHFYLGKTGDPIPQITNNFRQFFIWLDTVHEPFARQTQLPACTVCQHHLGNLPLPEYNHTGNAP
ncbi:MAG: radical SAM protein [Cyanobacteriota bacterium]|nr:radical SAM protein [Cyanobacteriota bacterium]